MNIDDTKLEAIKEKMYNHNSLTLEEQAIYAADALKRNVPMKEIASILGKSSTSISMNLYQHGFTATEEEIAFANLVRENKLSVKDIMLATKQSSRDVYKGLAAALYYVKEEEQYPTWAELYRMHNEDRIPATSLAKLKGCAMSTLKQHFAKLSNYKPPMIQGTETWDELLIMLKNKTITLQDICISKSISTTVVLKELERVGYHKSTSTRREENKNVSWDEMYELYKQKKMTVEQIMEAKNCTKYILYKEFEKRGYIKNPNYHRKSVICL